MAGDWIKMRVDLKDDPSVFKLAELLDLNELHVIGGLFCFWAWIDKHAVDGHVDGATSRLVDRVSSTPGFCDAMQAVGWIVVSPSGISVPNFDRHNGESAKERGLKNARQARWRSTKDAPVDVAVVAHVDAPPSTSPSTEASTREEKRREERKDSSSPDKPAMEAEKFSPTFEAFWAAYPRKVGKDAAAKAFAKRRVGDVLLNAMLVAIARQRAGPDWRKDGGQFIPHPSTWLNEGRWMDDDEGRSSIATSTAWEGAI